MRLQQYKDADCTLFRRPAAELTALSRRIETAILEVWTRGGDAEQAINAVLNNAEIYQQLSEKINRNMAFQRAAMLEGLQRDQEVVQQELAQQVQQELDQVDADFKALHQAEWEKAEQARQEQMRIRQEEEQTRERLAEAELEVQRRLEELGGEQALELLARLEFDGEDSEDAGAASAIEEEEPVPGQGQRSEGAGALGGEWSPGLQGLEVPNVADGPELDQDGQCMGISWPEEELAAGAGAVDRGAMPGQAGERSAGGDDRKPPGARIELLPLPPGQDGPAGPEGSPPAASGMAREAAVEPQVEPGILYRWFQRTPLRRRIYRVLTYELW